MEGSCLKTGQHLFFIIYLLLPIKCIIFYSVSKILFKFFLLPMIRIRLVKILLRNVYKITNKLDVDPQRDDDASPMSTYRCMLRPT